MSGSQAALLPDGRRLHLHHGPIDLIVEGFGPESARHAAYAAATDRFATILEELVAELGALRRPVAPNQPAFAGPTARRMAAAVAPHAQSFVTPMAAVAGAVAEEVLAALFSRGGLERAYVNNGGDIALWLSAGTSLTAAIARPDGLADRLTIGASDPVRGIATSGWRGRSHSLGIADAVTVTARTAAAADVAATLIANAVDLPGHPAVNRRPAHELDTDSDLGAQAVTVAVGALSGGDVDAALEAGAAAAEGMASRGLIEGAALFLGGRSRIVARAARPARAGAAALV